jgi:hypothetical protein
MCQCVCRIYKNCKLEAGSKHWIPDPELSKKAGIPQHKMFCGNKQEGENGEAECDFADFTLPDNADPKDEKNWTDGDCRICERKEERAKEAAKAHK